MLLRLVSKTTLAVITVGLLGCQGADQDPGAISTTARPIERGEGSQILFGDLHVHTTYSMDAFFTSLPITGGEGAHPPADACDFARHCSGLDFFAITDHAMEMTPAHWAMEKDATRECNAVAGDPANPDLVAFHGWEWTQVGLTPETHWGHKNVIFKDLGEDEVPARPISAKGPDTVNPWMERAPTVAKAWLIDPLNARPYWDFGWMVDEILGTPACDPDVHTRELPVDCHENAPTPDIPFRKLDEWGFDSLVIPHGTAWGSYSPPGTALDKQLTPTMHDPGRQSLIEVMSGHGNSEQYRSWREFDTGEDGELICPEPTDDYLPCCWRAGEIIRERCGDLPADVCEERVQEAMQFTMRASVAPDQVLPGTDASDWLDCGQDRRGFKPAYGLRPRGTAQYALALSRDAENEGDDPLRFRFGLIGSSDTHSGRPSTGYKQTGPIKGMTDAVGIRSAFHARLILGGGEPDDPQRAEPPSPMTSSALVAERMTSFLYPGGSVAVHAEGRDRDAIWDGLRRREVYSTSGPRMLLWFDLVGDGEDATRHPMGSEVETKTTPRFEARAVGAFVQKPGCPDRVVDALGAERVESLCLNECDHPSDTRHAIAGFEVVRIRPQRSADEDVTSLVEDPWLTLACEPDPAGCAVQFEDPEFSELGRDTVYYVRALQTPTPAINGANLRTRFEDGRAVSLQPCRVGAGADPSDDCLADVQERAWSSPLFVDYPR
ncbi:MAG: DUF3604 domain-containing protein [bacterium]|nr:DUF3604 domain-containing protein [bacterium]